VSPDSAWPFLSDANHPFLSAVWAVVIHGVLGILVVAPIIWRSDHRVRYALLAFVGGSALDLDHFIAAGSLNLHTIETMSGRPATHSLGFIVILALLALALTRRLLAAWAVFAVNLSHLLFDAAGGGVRVLYPLAHPDGLPWLACPVGALALLGASTWIGGDRSRRSSQRLDPDHRDALPVG
jgi:LexA-binding, inner membrane-associated putative hydrolase